MLKDYLSKVGKTTYALSKETGIAYSTLNDFVNGKVPVDQCKAGMIRKLAKALSVSMDDLYSMSENEETEIETEYGVPVRVGVRHKTFFAEFTYAGKPSSIELCKVSEAASYYIHEIARWRAEEYIAEHKVDDDCLAMRRITDDAPVDPATGGGAAPQSNDAYGTGRTGAGQSNAASGAAHYDAPVDPAHELQEER